MLTAEAQFVICANCGEWAWNGTYRIGMFIMLEKFFTIPSAVCFCQIWKIANQDNLWFDPTWWTASDKFLIDLNLICKN